jgi:short-subunit dehydrogenase
MAAGTAAGNGRGDPALIPADRTAHPRAVVTGASSGIGCELARELAARGHDLIIVGRRHARLAHLAAELRAAHEVEVDIRWCDLADRRQRARLCDELERTGVSVMCSNAGFGTCGGLRDADLAREAEQVEVDVLAVHELTLAVLPGMVARRAGRILVTGSTAGEQPIPTAATYAASKAFVNSFAEALHVELRGTGVTCTLLEPGPVRTEWTRVAGLAGEGERRWFEWMSPERVAKEALAALVAGQRVVVPGLLAKAQALAGRHAPRGLMFRALEWVVLPLIRSAGRTRAPQRDASAEVAATWEQPGRATSSVA